MLNSLAPVDPDHTTCSEHTSYRTVESQHRTECPWKRTLDDLNRFHSRHGRTPTWIRPVYPGEDRLARWWHRQLAAAYGHELTAEQVRLLDTLFSEDET
ncbi:hypothetical protein E8P82_08885 [Arthrobacter echini]|uniref:Helicase-associated domain-containing protein n=1 Tax=Arthrobacter echini TaxID=1529066 RepID=A0A4S5E4W7_9MICC|nr:helicase associated domain-containing protein [Arthrobacter echini]THJ66556.1 hypothetical protein E8P82_08885 [Arthrobacter echini]